MKQLNCYLLLQSDLTCEEEYQIFFHLARQCLNSIYEAKNSVVVIIGKHTAIAKTFSELRDIKERFFDYFFSVLGRRERIRCKLMAQSLL